ncbi:uncharacterized protein LOC107620950 [Arachis ipaensis]|uniref:uncharacterized protein LOC107620950 n=1 Tax=Arachis ipaensis TaxID=130454 RepID=UPI0007AFDA4C|nr:uncharacterized protein LOC107620950 [Arachis ipaensis]
MFNNCKDAFVICKYARSPSYFITITCNPEWDEIKRLLKDIGFKAEDRPNIVSRIFNIKLSQLIADFKQGKFFGKISGYVCIVEFQKRGLLHAHILLFMHPLFKPKTPEDIDKHISSEIPDKHSRHKLYAAVEKFMAHGLYGRVDGKPTKMLAWMLANRLFPFGPTLTYSQFPNKFVWKEDISLWMPRKQDFSIGILTHVPRGSGEDYYLRLLLNIQKACVSFVDIRTVAGIVYSTFKEACYALGLLQDDKEFVDAILEAGNWASANYIHDLFVMLLLSNNMGRLENVWQQCYDVLSEDILYFQRKSMQSVDLQQSEDQIMNLTLSKIEEKLQANGRSLRELDGMPFPSFDTIEGLDDRLIMDELNFDIDVLRNQLDTNLTNMNTFLYNTLSVAKRSKGKIVLNVASSGIASLLLPNGRTAHSRFKIPLDLNEDSICCIKQGTSLSKLVCRAKLIIWDEAPMLNKLCYEALDRCLRDIVRFEPYYNPELPFGEKVMVLGGDFRQILPVIPMGSRQDIVQAAINSAYLWQHCNVLKLTINMRLIVRATYTSLSDVSQFASWLLNIGDGIIGDSTDGESIVVIPDVIIIQDFDQLVDFVYPNLLININNTSFFKDRSILSTMLTHL